MRAFQIDPNSKEYLLAKIDVDTAENELLQVLFNIIQSSPFSQSSFQTDPFFNILQYCSILFNRVLNRNELVRYEAEASVPLAEGFPYSFRLRFC